MSGHTPFSEIKRDAERWTCTKERPYTKEHRLWEHPDAVSLGDVDHDDGTCTIYKCPNCDLRFHQEQPD